MKLMPLAALAAAMVFSAAACAADLVVIVSARNPLSALRPEQVAEIFLAQVGRFPDGLEATPLDLPVGSALRDEFYARVAAKSPPLMRSYWTKMIFTGRGQPPRELDNSIAIRRLVAAHPGMIAYIDRAAVDDSVHVVLAVP